MKIKVIAALLLLSITFTALFYQVKAVSAHTESPLTPPVTFFQSVISGTVLYHFVGLAPFFHALQRYAPAAGVLVTASNFFDDTQKFSTLTDANGNYSLPVVNGLYQINVQGGSQSADFMPPIRVLQVKNRTRTASFQGLIFH